MTPDFGRMLSVGTIRFEDRHCASKKGRIGCMGEIFKKCRAHGQLAVEWPWLALTGPFLTSLAQMDAETTPLPLKGHMSRDL